METSANSSMPNVKTPVWIGVVRQGVGGYPTVFTMKDFDEAKDVFCRHFQGINPGDIAYLLIDEEMSAPSLDSVPIMLLTKKGFSYVAVCRDT